MDLQKETVEYIEQLKIIRRVSAKDMDNPRYHPILVMMLIMNPSYERYFTPITKSFIKYILDTEPELINLFVKYTGTITAHLLHDSYYAKFLRYLTLYNLFRVKDLLKDAYRQTEDKFDETYGGQSDNVKLSQYNAKVAEVMLTGLLAVNNEIMHRKR